MSTIVLALLIGGAFGFALDRVGATDPGVIIRMLKLSDLHLMRTILLGIGTASILTFGGLLAGVVDPGHLSVKDAYAGVFVGGLILGAGFALSGYCPGTGLTALATGRRDAAFFALGGLAGAAAYMASYPWVESTGILAKIAGGKATIGAVAGTDYPALLPALPGELAGIVLGVAFIALAILLPRRLAGARAAVPAE